MKKLSPSIVLVKDIRCNTPKHNFDAEKLDIAARLILDIEGIISPIIVCREGVEHYQVIHGDFEYYAAMRAREIDSIRGETIDAYIVNTETQETIEKQIRIFRNSDDNQANKPMNNNDFGGLETLFKSCLQPVMDRLTAIESQLAMTSEQVEMLSQQREPQKQEPVQIDIKIETPTPLSENEQIVSDVETEKFEPIQPKENVTPEISKSIPVYLQLINELSSDILAEKLKQLFIIKPTAKAIVETRPFESEAALSLTKGVAAKTMEKLKSLPTLLDNDVSKPAIVESTESTPNKQDKPPVKETSPVTTATVESPESTPNKQDKPPVKETSPVTIDDTFLSKLNQMDQRELFFKIKRATTLNDKKINNLIENRPYQALSDIKGIGKKQLEKIRPLLVE